MKIIILLILTISTSIAFFFIDKQLFYYGRSTFDFYKPLPLKIKAQYWNYDLGNLGFVLVDDYDMTLIAKGDRYFGSDIEVKEVLKYGYNDEKLIGQIVALDNKKYYVECLKSDANTKRDITTKVWGETYNALDENYNWIIIKNAYIDNEITLRNCLGLLIIIFIISAFCFLLKAPNLRKHSKPIK